jgi:membrane protease YdiL (CAAX protease family)
MAKSDMPVPRRWRGLTVHARGHFLLFDPRSAPHWDTATGARLLLIAVGSEAIRLVAVRWLHLTVPLLILVLLFLAGVLGLVRFGARLTLSQIGLCRWSAWSAVEKSYFVQLLVIANVVFPLVFANRLRLILAQPSVVATVWSAFVPYLFFGFYQEVVYRGILQSELVRRWGALAGILGANVFYTFGPLHWYYFAAHSSLAVPMFAAIFAIGLFFGVLFWRSGNLWIVAIIHGIGNAYIVGSLSAR